MRSRHTLASLLGDIPGARVVVEPDPEGGFVASLRAGSLTVADIATYPGTLIPLTAWGPSDGEARQRLSYNIMVTK